MTIETLDATIAQLQAEARTVAHAPRSIAERYGQAEAELRDAERIYRTWGLHVGAGDTREAAHLQRQRVEAEGEGITAPDKTRRLAELRGAILKAAAKRELLLREQETAGEFSARPVHAELAVYKRSEVERLAR
jgi:hypothetical protein